MESFALGQKQRIFMVGQNGLEPSTSRLSVVCSSQLSCMMIKSATLGTVIGSGSIEYLTPYARRQYYEHKSRARWFETMKASKKDVIREGAEKLAAR